MKQQAFTLAEVLITLGIIGVVASLTMPGLVRDYQSRIYETSKTVFKTRMGEALRQMNIADNLTGYTETKQFVDALKKYMKIIKTCEQDKVTECFVDKVNSSSGMPIDVATSGFSGTEGWNTKIHGIVLQNGTSVVIKYNPNCQSSGITAKAGELEHCVAIAYDTNGKSKPNAYNKDIQGDALSLRMVQMNGFKMTETEIPYGPLNTTLSENKKWDPAATGIYATTNYWAGARKACGDLGLELPKGYGVNTTNWGYCNGTKPSGSGAVPSKTSQACQIYDWCKLSGNTCSFGYWLTETYSANNYAVYDVEIPSGYVSATDKNVSGRQVRCVAP